MISPDSFLMLIIICLFLCLLICLGPFLASSVSSISSFLFLRALVLRFFFVFLSSLMGFWPTVNALAGRVVDGFFI